MNPSLNSREDYLVKIADRNEKVMLTLSRPPHWNGGDAIRHRMTYFRGLIEDRMPLGAAARNSNGEKTQVECRLLVPAARAGDLPALQPPDPSRPA
jgi:hypothetical protein